jgi:hypothetical protein
MFLFYKLGLHDVFRIKNSIQSNIDAGTSPTEAVYLGMQEVEKIFNLALDKHKRKFLERVEYHLVKHFVVDQGRAFDPMEQFYPKPSNLPDEAAVSIKDILSGDTPKPL